MVVNFTPVERFILGSILGLLTGFVSAGVFAFDQDLAELVGVVVTVFGGVGVVPPTAETVLPFLRNPLVSLLLTLLSAVLVYVVNHYVDNLTLAGIVTGIVTFLASIGFVPPQATARRA